MNRRINRHDDGTPVELTNLMGAVEDGIVDMWGEWAKPEWEIEHTERDDGVHTWEAYCRSNLTDITLTWQA